MHRIVVFENHKGQLRTRIEGSSKSLDLTFLKSRRHKRHPVHVQGIANVIVAIGEGRAFQIIPNSEETVLLDSSGRSVDFFNVRLDQFGKLQNLTAEYSDPIAPEPSSLESDEAEPRPADPEKAADTQGLILEQDGNRIPRFRLVGKMHALSKPVLNRLAQVGDTYKVKFGNEAVATLIRVESSEANETVIAVALLGRRKMKIAETTCAHARIVLNERGRAKEISAR